MRKITLTAMLVIAISAIIAEAKPAKKHQKNTATASVTIMISNFKFDPPELKIKAGATVTWVVESGNHTVISDGNSFTSEAIAQGKSFSHQFSKAGKYPYYCSFHGSKGGKDMAGIIIVTP